MSLGRRLPAKALAAARANGWRSGLEESIAAQLDAAGISYRYEDVTIPFLQPTKPRRYTPDFILPNGIIIETKGHFVTADRQKHLLVKQQHPALDIRFVFSNPNTRISKQSDTTYGAWADHKGFKYAKAVIPVLWLREPMNLNSLVAIERLLED